MQEVRLWEVTPDGKLQSISGNEIHLEEQLEDWLADDISILDENLLVIGRQVKTDYGGVIDLLCLDGNGDTVIVELKKGKTPREVAAQTLDYASWISGLDADAITNIAEDYLATSGGLKSEFEQRLERELPEELSINHRSLIVAESIDASTERIVRYLSSMDVPINVATVQHFRNESGRSILAQVYLIEPGEEEVKPQPNPRKVKRATVKDIQEMADKNGIGTLFSQLKNGLRGVLYAQPYVNRMWYKLRRKERGFTTVLIVHAIPHKDSGGAGLGFTVHATRVKEHLDIDLERLKTWLPVTSKETERVRTWSGSTAIERQCAIGLDGFLRSEAEVEEFVTELKNVISRR